MIAASLQGLPNFLAYFLVALVAIGAFVGVYVLITPHREFDLIRAGNSAAATSLGGAVIGFTLPLASTIAHSVSMLDMAIWSAVALVAQIGAYFLASILVRGVSQRIADNDTAAGVTMAATSITIGIVNAACIAY